MWDPESIICNSSKEQKSVDLKRFLHKIDTTLRILEEDTPWSNKYELYIGILKKAVRKDMTSSNSPLPFWDYCLERRARINNLTGNNLFQLHGQKPTLTYFMSREISQTYVSLSSMSGYTIDTVYPHFQTTRKSLVAAYDLQLVKDMRWLNGFSNTM